MKIQELYQLYSESYLADTDTRKIRKGSIFFALKGANFNGNQFVKQALEQGARYCVIDEEAYHIGDQTILVTDVLKTLQELATFHRNELGIPILSLTGSNGKTTTKELIHAVLKTQFQAEATLGNLNNHIGVPLTLLSFTPKTDIGIVEMGANHQKEIEFLASIAQPDYGYITNFGKAHLEGFGGVEGVIKGKSELYTYLRTHSKTVFVNPKDPKQLELTEGMNRILFSEELEVQATNPFIILRYKGVEMTTQLMGSYNVSNLFSAISIGTHFGISTKNIQYAIEGYASSNNRSQIINTEKNVILLDAYNANPSSVSLALENFAQTKHPNKVVVLGDMFELGSVAAEEHQAMVDLAQGKKFQRSIFVGKNYFNTSALEKYEDFETLHSSLKKTPLKDTYIFIKGSRGMALERLLEVIP